MSESEFGVTVEVSVAFDGSGPLTTTPIWTDVSAYVRGGEWSRGKDPTSGAFPAGSGSVLLDNSDGRFYPHNTSGPYSPNVTASNPIRIQVTYNAVTYGQFFGYVESWTAAYPTNTEELVRVPIVERVARLNRSTVDGPYSQENSDVRVGNVLTEAGWPAAWRSLDSGLIPVAAYPQEPFAVLGMLRDVQLAEAGHIFQNRDGNIRFVNRAAASGVAAAATFGPSGADLTYTDVTVEHDEAFLFNQVAITDTSGVVHEKVDAASVTKHGPVRFEAISETVLNTDGQNVALWHLEKSKTVFSRIVGFEVDPAGDPTNLWPVVLARDLRDVIRVKVAYPGSAVDLNQLVAVDKVTHRFTAGNVWTTSYLCSPLSTIETQDYWILGTSLLGTGTRLI